jgi:hypothetical protein
MPADTTQNAWVQRVLGVDLARQGNGGAPRSVLPEPPEAPGTQASAMVLAARSGVAFCEECAA